MIVEAPEQQVALGSDAIRQIMGQRTNTLPNRIFVYLTRTINNPSGQPFTAVSVLALVFKSLAPGVHMC
jgi:hypothetical protein